MAVAYPSEGDKEDLVAYMRLLSAARGPDTADSRALCFSEEDILNVESACQSVLENVGAISRFFTGGRSLAGRHSVTGGPDIGQLELSSTVYNSGSVFPHARTSVAPIAVGVVVLSQETTPNMEAFRDPRSFFGPKRDVLQLMAATLDSSREELQRANGQFGYVWTVDIKVLRQYARELGGGRARMIPALSDDAGESQEEAAREGGGGNGDHGKSFLATSTAQGGEQSSQALLSLSDDELPSESVKNSYAKFVQVCGAMLEWIHSIVEMLDGVGEVPKTGTFVTQDDDANTGSASVNEPPSSVGTTAEHNGIPPTASTARPPRTRTVRVRRYEIRDVGGIYAHLYEQMQWFFLPEYIAYDARIRGRLLQPSYFYSLRDLIQECTLEIMNLEDIELKRPPRMEHSDNISPYSMHEADRYDVRHAASKHDSTVVFQPSLPTFRFLRNSLRVYLSTSINEDDLTSLHYYEQLYNGIVSEARTMSHEVQRLPKPPRPPAFSEAFSAARQRQQDASELGHAFQSISYVNASLPPPLPQRQGSGGSPSSSADRSSPTVMFETSYIEGSTGGNGGGGVLAQWPPSQADRGKLLSGFEAFWGVRAQAYCLKNALQKDIKRKDRSHRTRLLHCAVENEKDAFATKAEDEMAAMSAFNAGAQGGGMGLWSAIKGSLQSIANIATCKAELDLAGTLEGTQSEDDGGVPMTSCSPYSSQKKGLLELTLTLWNMIEVLATQLEATYPGIFIRGEKEKWARRVDAMMKKASDYSVVFDA